MPPPAPTPDSDSLVRRLAGPSVNKAGLAKDQTDINRIIAEASKGSKFYENEKRKDKDLTERIERILKYRDEAIKGVDLGAVEQEVDKLVSNLKSKVLPDKQHQRQVTQLEAQRDLSQIIVHVDMDAFYASVELLDNPELATKPFGVGHGVLTTASYKARKYGVRSGMPTFIAKKLCPELIVISNHFHRYSDMSGQVMAIFRRYDPNMAAAGCDEGYLNITHYCEEHSIPAEECVSEMRKTVHRETSLTVSAGIAPNKMLAKICSDKNKPDGQFKLDFEADAIKAFMRDLSIRKLPGVGRVNERLLESIGIKICGDIFDQRAVLSLLDKQFGLMFLLQAYLGIASNVVEPWQREERKSIGAERTFNTISDTAKIYAKLEEVAEELSKDMTEGGWSGKTITLKYKLDTYQVFTRAKSLDKWVSTKKEDLFGIGKELLKPELPLTIRLIGLRVTKLKDLQAEAESKARGIKRFFESAPSSPSKKRRTDVDHAEEHEDEDEIPQMSQDGFATSMPGYLDEGDAEAEEVADSQELDVGLPSSSIRTKPLSALVRSKQSGSSSSASASLPRRKPTSARPLDSNPQKADRNSAEDDVEVPAILLECPLCGKLLETDNQGLNEHVDFCLSKKAIKEAQAASLKRSSDDASTSSSMRHTGHKPTSRRHMDDKGGHGAGLLRYRRQD